MQNPYSSIRDLSYFSSLTSSFQIITKKNLLFLKFFYAGYWKLLFVLFVLK